MRRRRLEHLTSRGDADLYLWHIENGRAFIVKCVRDPEDRAAVRSLEREITVLTCGASGLVSVLGSCPLLAAPNYVMPFMTGALTDWAGELAYDELRAILARLALTCAELHDRDIAHGDIKPDNILVSDGGVVFLSDPLGNDSGCTVAWSEYNGGTPGYWAPEIAQGRPISKAGDMFSLGATMFHLATGIEPEDGDDLDPWRRDADVPCDLRDFILCACDREPMRRPAMRGVVRSMDRRAQPPASRVRSAYASAATVGVFALGAVATWQWFRAR